MSPTTGERRVVSVLMTDIADSTTIGERLGPERSKFLFDEVIRLIAAEVKRFGGTVAQLTGDGLYALFGAPTAHEDDAERAVRAALAVQAVLTGYGRDVAEAYEIDLRARIGVNTGPVVLLPEDAPYEERYNSLGDTVNVAARLQAHAGPNSVAVGHVTARQVQSIFELAPLGALDLKGKTEPVQGYRVVGEREGVQHRVSLLVGRDSEVAALEDVMSALVEGRGTIVAITGEPGIGKSRLVAEARGRWSESVRFLQAQGVSYAEEIPYYPLRELLRGFLDLGVSDPEARLRLELKLQLEATLGARAAAYYPFLASLLGLALEEEASERLSSLARDSVQRQTHEAVLELCRALSLHRPLCLVLEDLHFADEPTLELCRELLALADEEAVCLLLLYRSDPDLPSWELGETAHRQYRHRFRELHLEALAPEDGARLAAASTQGVLTAEAATELVERTGGNPLFVEEAARDLVERGDGVAVPAAIQETLQARLARLAPETREVAAVASVVGRTFGTPLLERVIPTEQLRPALSELQRHDLVVEERRRPTPEYRFRHGLVHEATYSSLLEERRRELHRVVGTALEELHGDELSEAYGLLARHFAEADEPERAARYLLEAGDAARSVYADEEAIAQYRRALPFLDRLGASGEARGVLFKIAAAHHFAFDFEAANAAWAEAFSRPEPSPRKLERTERIETLFLRSPGDFVPGYSYDIVGWTLTPNLYRGLFRLDRGLDVRPDLADRIEISPDGSTYRFGLRQGLRWSDGEPLSAADFAFTFRAMGEREVETAQLLSGLECRAPDEHTVELRVSDPGPFIPYLLAAAPLFPWPQHCVEALGDSWPLPEAFVGNGPFVLAEVNDAGLLLAANPLWDGPHGNLDEVAVGFRLPSDGLDDWRDGHLDFLFSPEALDLAETSDTAVRRVALLGVVYLGLNRTLAPLDDERVRRALAHGLDRGRLLMPGAEPARGGFLPPAMPGHSHDLALPFDLDRARALLSQAGFSNGKGLPELELVHPDWGFTDEFRRTAEARWRSPWPELGVRVRHKWLGRGTIYEEVGRSHLVYWGWNADYPDPDGMLGTFLGTMSRIFGFSGTDDVARSRASRSSDDRLRSYREIDRQVVAERVEAVPLWYDAWFLVHRPWIEGFWATPTQLGSLEELVVRRPG